MSLLFRIYPGIKAYQFLFTFSNRKWADQECLQILKIIMAKQWAYKKYLLLISFFSNTFIPFHNTTVCIRNCANDLEIFAFNLLIPMATLFLLLSQYFSSLWLLEWPQEWTVVFPPDFWTAEIHQYNAVPFHVRIVFVRKYAVVGFTP